MEHPKSIGDRAGDRLAVGVEGLLRHPPTTPGGAKAQQVSVRAAEQRALQGDPQVELT
ncbi:unannotated protein [freshwater metagenome]|uniref:Unannotated protein n=1 Tax=freshwater metagenome TaxID=449393 RepID=A0A6J6UFN4_9ZZZZ